MTSTPHTPTLSAQDAARVSAYLDDLGRMLDRASAADRADALGSVREQLDDELAAVGPQVTSEDVTAILRRLGAPQDVAADLFARGIVRAEGVTSATAPAPTPAPAPAPAPAGPGDGLATAALVLGVVAVLLPVVGALVGIGAVYAAVRARRLGTDRHGRRTVGMVLGLVALVGNVLVLGGLLSFRTSGGEQTQTSTATAVVVGRAV